jgi:hypothetical protein
MPPQENLRPSSLVVRGLSYAAVISAAFVAVACSDVPDDAGQHPHSGASVGAAASAPTPFLPPSSGSSSQGDAATPPAAPTPPALSIEDACKASAKANCKAEGDKTPETFALRYTSMADCESKHGADCEMILETPATGWTPELSAQCAAAWTNATVDEVQQNPPPSACKDPPGKKPDGAPCIFRAECAGRACIAAPNVLCGICGKRRLAGESCHTGTGECEDGLRCVDEKCVAKPYAKIGAACTHPEDCDFLTCHGTWVYTEATQSWAISGGTCQAYSTASVGLACGQTLGSGTTSVPIVSNTACIDGWCKRAKPEDQNGVCQAFPSVGQACTPSIGCGWGAICAGYMCVETKTASCN